MSSASKSQRRAAGDSFAFLLSMASGSQIFDRADRRKPASRGACAFQSGFCSGVLSPRDCGVEIPSPEESVFHR
jgi:hypothetical protein